MLYRAYQTQRDALLPLRFAAQAASGLLSQPQLSINPLTRPLAAGLEIFSQLGLTHKRPPFGIETTLIDGEEVPIIEEVTLSQPFGNLLHFKKAIDCVQPRILVVAPLSGHFATLLRGTVRALLPDHDVYITDWKNARDVSVLEGRFDFDDYLDTVMLYLQQIGPRAHVLAVCQPAVPVLAAVALMAACDDPGQPATMTLMGGPIDTRRNPTVVNELAQSHSIEWFERNVVDMVPLGYTGAFRRVYPGFLQLTSFMLMNLDRHLDAYLNLFKSLVHGDGASVEATRKFYDEYLAVMDMPAEFYLQTIREVFQEHQLPRGVMKSRDRLVEPQAITKTALLTVEGEKDDICAVGQTGAAQDLCTALAPSMRGHHIQPGVGHYGVFNGKRWQNEIYPIVKQFVLEHA